MEMFDEVISTHVGEDGKVTVKREPTDAELEMADAVRAYKSAERKWQTIDAAAMAQEGIPANLCEWFDALEERYKCDKQLWLLFIGKDRSVRSNRMYTKFRKSIVSGDKVRADA